MEVVSENTKGCIILLEDEQSYVDSFKNLFEDLEIDLDLIPCLTTGTYEQEIEKAKVNNRLRCLIMDLSNTHKEEDSREYKATEFIRKEFEENRIPIFVHSANLEHYSDFPDKGTVFKIPKSSTATTDICKRIKEMEISGFLNIFCLGGNLEKKIMFEVHKAFVEQFKGGEIEKIIESIKSTNKSNYQERTTEVFERIAIRAVYENWISANKSSDDEITEIKLNEHYYRRSSDFVLWTGDVLKHNKNSFPDIIILTPRCNLGHENYGEILICEILPLNFDVINEFTNSKIDNKETGETKGEKSLRTSITDDVTNKRIGERFRFLPPTPQYKGGFVNFNAMFTKKTDEILNNYTNTISLSDELTNDIVRKFSTYLQRGGISETEFKESHHYVLTLIKDNEEKK